MEIINRMSGSWFMLDVDNLIKFMADQRRGQKQGSEGRGTHNTNLMRLWQITALSKSQQR